MLSLVLDLIFIKLASIVPNSGRKESVIRLTIGLIFTASLNFTNDVIIWAISFHICCFNGSISVTNDTLLPKTYLDTSSSSASVNNSPHIRQKYPSSVGGSENVLIKYSRI